METNFPGTMAQIKQNQKILLFSGSNNPESINQFLIRETAVLLQEHETTVISLIDFNLPLYSEHEEQKQLPSNATALLELIDDHDILVIAVPEHNSSVPAFFKNAMDWISRSRQEYRVLLQKQVLLLSASPGNGGRNAVSHAKTIVEALGANVLHSVILSNFYHLVFQNENKLQLKDTAILRSLIENIPFRERQKLQS